MLLPEMTRMQELWIERIVVPVPARCVAEHARMQLWPQPGLQVGHLPDRRCLQHLVCRSFGVCPAFLFPFLHPDLVEG